MTDQIKSKERVAEHGEVFTAGREVNAMLNLVKDESYRIDSRFLEPACGTGNFIIEILNRKMETVVKKYSRSKSDFEKYAIVALSSIYGVDIMEDNAKECRERLYTRWNEVYSENCDNDECRNAAKFIINRNILYGDALTMLQNDGQPIIFSQWDIVNGNKMKRRDYRLDQLMKATDLQMDFEMYVNGWKFDEESNAWVPPPIKEYPIVNYWEVQYVD